LLSATGRRQPAKASRWGSAEPMSAAGTEWMSRLHLTLLLLVDRGVNDDAPDRFLACQIQLISLQTTHWGTGRLQILPIANPERA
jgi:hypothetical protein